MKDFGNVRRVPQTEKAEKGQVKMASGGYGYKVDRWQRLMRFLVLGSEGTFYVREKTIQKQALTNLRKLIEGSGPEVVDVIREVSTSGRAPRQDYTLYALASCMVDGNEETRRAAFDAFLDIARTPYFMFAVAEYMRRMGVRPGNSGTSAPFKRYYEEMPLDSLAYHMVKYQKRRIIEKDPTSDWTHKDLILLSHPRMGDGVRNNLARFAMGLLNGEEDIKGAFMDDADASIVYGAYRALRTNGVAEAVRLIDHYGLTHEMVSNAVKKDKRVWAALLNRMPVNAMLRNLGKMTAIGLLDGLSNETGKVVEMLGHQHKFVHPIDVLKAWHTYQQGKGDKGSLEWTPVSQIVAALENMFYASFKGVEPTGKRVCYAIDTSGSMWGGYFGQSTVAGLPWLKPAEAGALMAMLGVRTESRFIVLGFDGRVFPYKAKSTDSLDDVFLNAREYRGGMTDASLPFNWLMQNRKMVDAVVFYTDNESWAGKIHTIQAAKEYRQRFNKDLKVVSVTFAPTKTSMFTDSENTLNVVGMDAGAHVLINSFIRGEV